MHALGDTIAQELASPVGRNLQERLLEALFLMERFRGVDAGWRDLPQVGDADVSADAIARLAQALRIFIQSYRDHPDVGSAIWGANCGKRCPHITDAKSRSIQRER